MVSYNKNYKKNTMFFESTPTYQENRGKCRNFFFLLLIRSNLSKIRQKLASVPIYSERIRVSNIKLGRFIGNANGSGLVELPSRSALNGVVRRSGNSARSSQASSCSDRNKLEIELLV